LPKALAAAVGLAIRSGPAGIGARKSKSHWLTEKTQLLIEEIPSAEEIVRLAHAL
jgi:hypothetical protein